MVTTPRPEQRTSTGSSPSTPGNLGHHLDPATQVIPMCSGTHRRKNATPGVDRNLAERNDQHRRIMHEVTAPVSMHHMRMLTTMTPDAECWPRRNAGRSRSSPLAPNRTIWAIATSRPDPRPPRSESAF
jgi:hypothetical protein